MGKLFHLRHDANAFQKSRFDYNIKSNELRDEIGSARKTTRFFWLEPRVQSWCVACREETNIFIKMENKAAL